MWNGSASYTVVSPIDWSTPKGSLYRQLLCIHCVFPRVQLLTIKFWKSNFHGWVFQFETDIKFLQICQKEPFLSMLISVNAYKVLLTRHKSGNLIILIMNSYSFFHISLKRLPFFLRWKVKMPYSLAKSLAFRIRYWETSKYLLAFSIDHKFWHRVRYWIFSRYELEFTTFSLIKLIKWSNFMAFCCNSSVTFSSATLDGSRSVLAMSMFLKLYLLWLPMQSQFSVFQDLYHAAIHGLPWSFIGETYNK